MSSDTTGVLVVGSGRAARMHSQNYHRIPAVDVRGFADVIPERAKELARAHGLEGPDTWFRDYEAALERDDIQVVDVCAPVRFHCEIALKAIEAGKHVLMEKPLAQSLAEADAMIRAAHKRGVTLGQIFQNRFHRTPRRIKALLDAGHLGGIVRARVTGTTIHGYDTFLWLFGDLIRLYAEWPGGVPEAEWEMDTDLTQYENHLHSVLRWNALVRFADGTVGVLQSGKSKNSVPQVFPYQTDDVAIDIVGERLSVIFTIWGQNVQFRMGPDDRGGYDKGHMTRVKHYFETLYPEASDTNGHLACMSDFYAALREGRAPLLTGEEGRRSVELLVGIHKSARDTVLVHFPISEEDAIYNQPIWPNP